MRTADERREALKPVWRQASTCTRCPQLAATRTTVVFGAGNADADLMFVGEAPGANEDRQGLPFVGQAGQLLAKLLGGIGLTREDVFICNLLKCRPPGNRDPLPQEIENCQEYLWAQLELVAPRVVCTLGNFSTKLLRGDPGTGITRLHGRPEERVLGTRAVRLYPLYHPAAALYTRRCWERCARTSGAFPSCWRCRSSSSRRRRRRPNRRSRRRSSRTCASRRGRATVRRIGRRGCRGRSRGAGVSAGAGEATAEPRRPRGRARAPPAGLF
jgi:DNA polymerase